MMEYIVMALVILGTFFILVAAIGLLRLPNLMTRIHAATKATSFGLLLILFGLGLHFGTWQIIIKSILLIAFIYLTAPLAASVIAKTAQTEDEAE